MQSQVFFYVDMQGKGKGPLPLHSIPKNQQQQQNQEQQQNQNQEHNQGRLHRRLDTPQYRHSTHPMKEDVKKKHFSTPLQEPLCSSFAALCFRLSANNSGRSVRRSDCNPSSC
jgi:hypothetical protein